MPAGEGLGEGGADGVSSFRFQPNHFLVASQLQLAFPVDVPFIRVPASRPRQYWVAIELVRVNEMLPPLTEPSLIVPTSCTDVPAKLPLKRPRDASARSNSPCQCPTVQSALHRQRPVTETPDG